MGSRIVDDQLDKGGIKVLGELVFAAPDEDADTFNALIARLHPASHTITMYASRWDFALWMSKRVHTAQRAGEVVTGFGLDGLDTVDATAVDTTLLGHSYFVHTGAVEKDIELALKPQFPPRPHLVAIQSQPNAWKLIP
jgi:esterase/lipase superfamily enzyme